MTEPDDMLARVARAKALDAQATPGPWNVMNNGRSRLFHVETDEGCPAGQGVPVCSLPSHERNADLIAEYRTLCPQLAADVEALRARLRHVAQLAIGVTGAAGPMNAEDAVAALVAENAKLREDAASTDAWLRENEVVNYITFDMGEFVAVEAVAALVAGNARLREDKARLDWLEAHCTLHTYPEFLYVVDGYQVCVSRDGNPSPAYEGHDLRSAIDVARQEKPNA